MYDIKSKKFLFENEDFIGLSQGGGYIEGRFYFGFEQGKNVKKIVIDTDENLYMEKIFTKKENKKLKWRSDGYYDKETNQPVYLFEKDFVIKKF